MQNFSECAEYTKIVHVLAVTNSALQNRIPCIDWQSFHLSKKLLKLIVNFCDFDVSFLEV
jgi:hypothetical protein